MIANAFIVLRLLLPLWLMVFIIGNSAEDLRSPSSMARAATTSTSWKGVCAHERQAIDLHNNSNNHYQEAFDFYLFPLDIYYCGYELGPVINASTTARRVPRLRASQWWRRLRFV